MDLILGAVEAGSLAFFSYTFYRIQNKQMKLQDLTRFVQKAAVVSPSILQKAMDVGGGENLLKNIKGFEEGKNYSKGLAFVQGVVESDQILRSFLNHSTKLVLSSVSSELIFSNNKNFEEANGKIDTKSVREFRLVDSSAPNENIVLNHTGSVQFGDALHLIHSIVHMRSLSPLEKFLSWILFCIKLFLSMSNVGKKLSGFKVGTKRVERGIMVGQFMIAFGEIIFDRFNKELRMSNPMYFMKDKEQLIYKLKEKRIALGRNMALLFTIMLMFSFFLAKRVTKGIGALIKRYQKYKELGRMDKFFKLKKLIASDFRCSECGDNVRNTIFKPCLHLQVCNVCYDKMLIKKCPACKKQVDDVSHIYVV